MEALTWSPLLEGLTHLHSTLTEATSSEHALNIPFWKLSLVVALLALPLVLGGAAKLHVNRPLIIAGVRCMLQLLLLGGVLKAIFATKSLLWVSAYIAFMMAIATMEASARPTMSYKVCGPLPDPLLQAFALLSTGYT